MATTEPLAIYNKFTHGNYRTTLSLQPIYTWQLQNHSQFTTNLNLLIACLIDVLHDFPFARPDNYIGLYDLNVLH